MSPANDYSAADMKRYAADADPSQYDHLMPADYNMDDGHAEYLRYVQCNQYSYM